jgi:hypothetical protein
VNPHWYQQVPFWNRPWLNLLPPNGTTTRPTWLATFYSGMGPTGLVLKHSKVSESTPPHPKDLFMPFHGSHVDLPLPPPPTTQIINKPFGALLLGSRPAPQGPPPNFRPTPLSTIWGHGGAGLPLILKSIYEWRKVVFLLALPTKVRILCLDSL